MPTLVIPDGLQLVVAGTQSGQPVINVMHFRNTSGGTRNLVTDLVAIKALWEKAAGPLKVKSNGFAMTGYKLTDISSTSGQVSELGSTVAGGVAGSLSTMASAALIRLSGGTRDRSGSGRLYHGPLLEGQINADGRQIDTGAATTLTTAYTTWASDMLALDLEWCVASRQDSTLTTISSITVSTIIATQRRRLR